MATSSAKFFSLLVPVAALIVTVSLMTFNTNLLSKANQGPGYDTELTYEFAPGWNSFSLPLTSRHTASDVCAMVESATTVSKMESNAWISYSCNDESAQDFRIQTHHGYMIRVLEAASWSMTGNFAKPKYSLATGLNFAGVPQSTGRHYYADTLCDLETDKNSEVVSISEWNGSGWNTHYCTNEDANNFAIEGGQGYMVNVALENATPLTIPSVR